MLTGGLAAAAGLSAKTIRFYEQAGLLPGTPGGYRDYLPAALECLAFVRRSQAAGLTLQTSAPSWPSATPATPRAGTSPP